MTELRMIPDTSDKEVDWMLDPKPAGSWPLRARRPRH